MPTKELLAKLAFHRNKLNNLSGENGICNGAAIRDGKKVWIFWIDTAPPLMSEMSIPTQIVHFFTNNPWSKLSDVPNEICPYKVGGKLLTDLVKNGTLIYRIGPSKIKNKTAREYCVNTEKRVNYERASYT